MIVPRTGTFATGAYGNAPPTNSNAPQARYGGLTPEEDEIIQVAFDAFKNDKEMITMEGLTEACKTFPLGDVDEIKTLIESFDENGDGEVDEDEWRNIMTRKFLGQDDDSSFLYAFEMLDHDKDGYIPIAEMRHILLHEGRTPLSDQEVDELLMFADLEGDGLIDYKSFLKWISEP
eukprot:CAMPEP_0178411826 /NCGR_PEP_ID=MMETSP0689_2-20121128/21695_1 /TAXON_ID=160604 /ORGANISM="Amphidinium massartii, Strain CS-259" /LENGTH=175 /DNA_ID=CAMNT_0020033045 /DNA_START=51 /DNA_END=574 /DNA_ORIENTATION=-